MACLGCSPWVMAGKSTDHHPLYAAPCLDFATPLVTPLCVPSGDPAPLLTPSFTSRLAFRDAWHHTTHAHAGCRYHQETGRAGRDGSIAYCVLFYAFSDALRSRLMIKNSAQENNTAHQVVDSNIEALNAMVSCCLEGLGVVKGCVRRKGGKDWLIAAEWTAGAWVVACSGLWAKAGM